MLTVNGVLIIDKPAGLTSHDVVNRVRKIIGERRVGHTGTLDPFATGVLVMLIGKGTRLLQFLSGAEKEYEGVIRFGYATDTGDVTGTPLPVDAQRRAVARLSAADIESAMTVLRGQIEQLPPMYSAKKIQGRKLYEWARRGEEIERAPVRVTINDFSPIDELTRRHDGSADLTVRVVCSAGTYVRTLAEDLGKRLGLGAHLLSLRRTRAGRFSLDDATTLDQMAGLADKTFGQVMISLDAAVAHLPAIDLDGDQVLRVLNGIDIETDAELTNQQPVRLRTVAGELIAISLYDAERRRLHPQVVLGQ